MIHWRSQEAAPPRHPASWELKPPGPSAVDFLSILVFLNYLFVQTRPDIPRNIAQRCPKDTPNMSQICPNTTYTPDMPQTWPKLPQSWPKHLPRHGSCMSCMSQTSSKHDRNIIQTWSKHDANMPQQCPSMVRSCFRHVPNIVQTWYSKWNTIWYTKW